jgi:hypothetical protein
MATPANRREAQETQVDPGESVEPRPPMGAGFDVHTWSIITKIFEKLGGIEAKVDQLASDQKALKDSVEKHDKLIMRAIFAVGGGLAVIVAAWFLYENFLEDHIIFKP